jgi:hypothetical protein
MLIVLNRPCEPSCSVKVEVSRVSYQAASLFSRCRTFYQPLHFTFKLIGLHIKINFALEMLADLMFLDSRFGRDTCCSDWGFRDSSASRKMKLLFMKLQCLFLLRAFPVDLRKAFPFDAIGN